MRIIIQNWKKKNSTRLRYNLGLLARAEEDGCMDLESLLAHLSLRFFRSWPRRLDASKSEGPLVSRFKGRNEGKK